MKTESYILLSDGTIFKGRPMGARGVTIGEAAFDTGMAGYQEMLTDPSFYGQIVAMTYPLAGNCGVNAEDVESRRIFVSGLIVRECCDAPSNFRCEGTLEQYLQDNNIIGIQGVDARALTRKLRSGGAMNAAIVSGVVADTTDLLEKIKNFKIDDAVKTVSVPKDEFYPAKEKRFNVSMLDCGYKNSMVRRLNEHGCDVTVKPYSATAEELTSGFDGVLLSSGPGDPADNPEVIAEIAKVMKSGVPVFGVCLGHQLMALAAGFESEKMKFGHRGGNHPVYYDKKDKVFITSQNHGFAIKTESVSLAVAEISHVNRHDGSVEGLRYKNIPAFSVQFHPEAGPGPQDSLYLFDLFTQLMEGGSL